MSEYVDDCLDMMDEWGPEKVVCVSDVRSGMRGVLVIDNTARGHRQGRHPDEPDPHGGEVARLARTMTWKWAAVDLFHGGAKAGILGDPARRTRRGSCARSPGRCATRSRASTSSASTWA